MFLCHNTPMIQVDPTRDERTYIAIATGGRHPSGPRFHIAVHGLDTLEVHRLVTKILHAEQARRISALTGCSSGAITTGSPKSGTGRIADYPDAGAGLEICGANGSENIESSTPVTRRRPRRRGQTGADLSALGSPPSTQGVTGSTSVAGAGLENNRSRRVRAG